MSQLELLLDPGFRLPLLMGAFAMMALSLVAIYLAGRRLLLTGMALAQLACAGAALSLLVPVPGVLLATLLTSIAASVSALWQSTRANSDSGLLVLYLLGGVAAQLLAAASGSGDAQILELLNGQLLLATSTDGLALGLALIPVLVLLATWRRPLLLHFTQPEFARLHGVPVRRLEALTLLAIGLLVGAAFPILGVLCTTAALTCPGLIALQRARSLAATPRIAMAIALMSYSAGVTLAFWRDWPPGPVIAGVLVLATSLTLLWTRKG